MIQSRKLPLACAFRSALSQYLQALRHVEFIPTLFGANYTSNRDLQADTPRSIQTQQNKVIGLYSVGINPDMGDIQGYQASCEDRAWRNK